MWRAYIMNSMAITCLIKILVEGLTLIWIIKSSWVMIVVLLIINLLVHNDWLKIFEWVDLLRCMGTLLSDLLIGWHLLIHKMLISYLHVVLWVHIRHLLNFLMLTWYCKARRETLIVTLCVILSPYVLWLLIEVQLPTKVSLAILGAIKILVCIRLWYLLLLILKARIIYMPLILIYSLVHLV